MSERDVLMEYAAASLAVDIALQNGEEPDPVAVQRMTSIEHSAAGLSPVQVSAALAHVESLKSAMISDMQAAEHEEARDVTAALATDNVGLGGQGVNHHGVSMEGLKQIKEGNKLGFRSKVPTYDRKVMDQRAQQLTQGKIKSMAQLESKLDDLEAAHKTHDENRLRAIAADLAMTVDEAQLAAKDWAQNGLAHHATKRLMEREGSDDLVEVKPTESDQLRAEILTNMIDNAPNEDEHYAEALTDSIDSRSLEDEDIRGDVARAMAAHGD